MNISVNLSGRNFGGYKIENYTVRVRRYRTETAVTIKAKNDSDGGRFELDVEAAKRLAHALLHIAAGEQGEETSFVVERAAAKATAA